MIALSTLKNRGVLIFKEVWSYLKCILTHTSQKFYPSSKHQFQEKFVLTSYSFLLKPQGHQTEPYK